MGCTYNMPARRASSPVVFIFGPTATGKSGLALRLAQHFDLEIISADSKYLYRGMNIGTAKPTVDELASVPHHLVDIVEPAESFSLAQYLDAARKLISEIQERDKLPFVVGGTPLYFRALIEGWRVPRVAPNEELRARLELENGDILHERLQAVDPVSASRIDPNNKRRVIRAIEVFEATGEPLSELEGKQPPPYDMLRLGLFQDRDRLYQRIDRRVNWMFTHGILDEARELLDLEPSLPSMSAIGYREARDVILGKLDVEEAIELTSFATHRYVRHQETWFRKFEDVFWLDSSESGLFQRTIGLIQDVLTSRSNRSQ